MGRAKKEMEDRLKREAKTKARNKELAKTRAEQPEKKNKSGEKSARVT